MQKYLVQIQSINKSFDDQKILNDISLDIFHGEFITLLGPSGCGKTTLLRILGGFETVDSGSVLLNGTSLLDTPAHKRAVNTIFQSYALFPHMNVFDNIAFGLRMKGLPTEQINEEVQRILESVKLSSFSKKFALDKKKSLLDLKKSSDIKSKTSLNTFLY